MEMASHFLEYHSQTVGAELATDERIFLDRPKSCFQMGFTCNYHTTMTATSQSWVVEFQFLIPQPTTEIHWVAIELQVLLPRCFDAQTWPDKESGVFQTSPSDLFQPSPFWCHRQPRSWWLWKPTHLHLRIFLLSAGLGEKSIKDEMLMLQKSQAPRNQPPVGCINKPLVDNERNFYIYVNLCNLCRISTINQLVLLM